MLTSHFKPHTHTGQLHANACMGHVLQSSLVPGVLFFWRLGLRLFQSSRSLSVQQSAIYFTLFSVWSVMA